MEVAQIYRKSTRVIRQGHRQHLPIGSSPNVVDGGVKLNDCTTVIDDIEILGMLWAVFQATNSKCFDALV